MTAETLAHALGARHSGSGWVAECPAHDDNNPSLSIRDAEGKVLLHCHAGCGQRTVIDALKAMGLWSAPPIQLPRIVEKYDYSDECGRLLYQVLRYEPKSFKQRRPDRVGGSWTWKKSARQVLYRLREVLEAPIVFVVEGERDVETLREYGFVATTNAGGAKAPWLPEFSNALAGREVIVIPDNDAPGIDRVERIAKSLIGLAARLVILKLEGAKDITDWFCKGHGELELIAAVEKKLAKEV